MATFCANCGTAFGTGNFCANCGNPKHAEVSQGVPSHFQKLDLTQSGVDEQRAKLIGAQAKNAELGGKLLKGFMGVAAVYVGVIALIFIVLLGVFLAHL
jgi:hypothetical protein